MSHVTCDKTILYNKVNEQLIDSYQKIAHGHFNENCKYFFD